MKLTTIRKERRSGEIMGAETMLFEKKKILAYLFIYIAVLISRDVKDWILNVKRRKEKKR